MLPAACFLVEIKRACPGDADVGAAWSMFHMVDSGASLVTIRGWKGNSAGSSC